MMLDFMVQGLNDLQVPSFLVFQSAKNIPVPLSYLSLDNTNLLIESETHGAFNMGRNPPLLDHPLEAQSILP